MDGRSERAVVNKGLWVWCDVLWETGSLVVVGPQGFVGLWILEMLLSCAANNISVIDRFACIFYHRISYQFAKSIIWTFITKTLLTACFSIFPTICSTFKGFAHALVPLPFCLPLLLLSGHCGWEGCWVPRLLWRRCWRDQVICLRCPALLFISPILSILLL